jgi:histone acetyltransferase SAS3
VGLFKRIYSAASGAGGRLNLATAVTYTMAATVPANHDDLRMNSTTALVDSDQDAEGEEDTDLYQMDQQLQSAVQKADVSDHAEEDGVGMEQETADTSKSADEEDDDAEEDPSDSDDDEAVGAVKLRKRRLSAETEDLASDAEDGEADSAFENGSEAKSISDSSSEAEAEDWEVESNDHDEIDGAKSSRGNCM